MRRAARISEAVIDGVIERIEPGLRKNELVAEIYGDLIRGVGGRLGRLSGHRAASAQRGGCGRPAPDMGRRAVPPGEATFFELAGCVRRYHVPFCRTVFLGRAARRDASRGGGAGRGAGGGAGRGAGRQRRGRRGARARRADGARRDRPGRALRLSDRLSYPPDWGERTASFREEDETVLRPGMTFHFMPGLWMDSWGLEITESILITEDGPAECFCDRPRRLVVKP
jgi:ectoine hydrolase